MLGNKDNIRVLDSKGDSLVDRHGINNFVGGKLNKLDIKEIEKILNKYTTNELIKIVKKKNINLNLSKSKLIDEIIKKYNGYEDFFNNDIVKKIKKSSIHDYVNKRIIPNLFIDDSNRNYINKVINKDEKVKLFISMIDEAKNILNFSKGVDFMFLDEVLKYKELNANIINYQNLNPPQSQQQKDLYNEIIKDIPLNNLPKSFNNIKIRNNIKGGKGFYGNHHWLF